MKLLNTRREREDRTGEASIEVRVGGVRIGTLERISISDASYPQVAELELDAPFAVDGDASFELDVNRLEINLDFMRLQGINFADAYDQLALDFPWHFVDPDEGDE